MNITPELLKKWYADYAADPANTVIAGAIAKTGIEDASFVNEVRRRHNFCFSHETKRGEITNQKQSGRCWMFSALNAARVELMERLNLENFEFSQNYTLFWDKLEYYMHVLISLRTCCKNTIKKLILFYCIFKEAYYEKVFLFRIMFSCFNFFRL